MGHPLGGLDLIPAPLSLYEEAEVHSSEITCPSSQKPQVAELRITQDFGHLVWGSFFLSLTLLYLKDFSSVKSPDVGHLDGSVG